MAVAGLIGGGCASMWSRSFWIMSGSVMSAMTRMVPPHNGHIVIRRRPHHIEDCLSRWAQVKGATSSSWPPVPMATFCFSSENQQVGVPICHKSCFRYKFWWKTRRQPTALNRPKWLPGAWPDQSEQTAKRRSEAILAPDSDPKIGRRPCSRLTLVGVS